MNGITFATSRTAGFAVVWIVACAGLVVLIVAGLIAERREYMRRAARVRDPRALRTAHIRARAPRLAMRVLRPGERAGMGDSEPSTRARLLGVDELDPSDDFAGFAEYGGALRQQQ